MRLWSVLFAAIVLMLAGTVPALAADGVEVSVTPTGVAPPSYTGICAPSMQFTATVQVTANGPGTVSYRWSHWQWGRRPESVTFTEAGTKTVTEVMSHYAGSSGSQSRTITVTGANQAQATVTYQLSCADAVPQTAQIQPANDYIGRCGADVVHTINARIDSPVAQAVRYRWVDGFGQPLPGLDGDREVVFTEPGSKTVSAPFQRVTLPDAPYGGAAYIRTTSPSQVESGQLYYRTTCVSAEFTKLTWLSGNCRTGAPFRYSFTGSIESNGLGEISYAWSRQVPDEGDEWIRDPWQTLTFTTSNSPGRQTVSKTWTAPMGQSGVWRLEIAGTDGIVASESRPYINRCG
ncbi:PKD domain-containing protein [Nonomuraea sp. NPDC004354]